MLTSGLGSPADDAAKTAILSAERQFFVDLQIDWNGDGSYVHSIADLSKYVDSVSVDRNLSGSAPTELMLIEGSAAAEITISLSGEWNGLPFPAVFSPYNGLSPLYNDDPIGREVKYRLGVETALGVIWYPQFVGNVRTITPERSSEHRVTITALDRAEKLRQPVRFPMWAISSYSSVRGWNEAQLMDSQWVIDHCVRSGNTSSTRYRPVTPAELVAYDSVFTPDRGGPQFWLTGVGSHVPTIGSMDSADVQGFPHSEAVGAPDMFIQNGEPHPAVTTEVVADNNRPYVLAGMGTNASGINPVLETPSDDRRKSFFLQYRAQDPELVRENGAHWIGFTLITTGVNGGYHLTNNYIALAVRVGWQQWFQIRINGASARSEIVDTLIGTTVASPYLAIPSGQNAVRIEAQASLQLSGGVRHIGVKVEDTLSAYNSISDVDSGSISPDDPQKGLIQVLHKSTMQDIYWTCFAASFVTFSSAHFSNYARKEATYAAVLDRGLNKLTNTPATKYEDAWQVITEVAAAELGSVWWDENGVLRFWNRDRMVAKQTIPVRSLTLDQAAGLQITNSSDSIRNIISADTTYATAASTRVFEGQDAEQFYCPANSEVYFRVPVTDVQSVTVWKLPRYATTPDVNVPGNWADAVNHGYVVQWYKSGAWVEDNGMVSGVDVYAFMDRDWNLVIKVHNGYSYPARLADTGDGNAAIRITGIKITKAENFLLETRDEASIVKYGSRNMQLQGDWVQWQPDVVTKLIDYTLTRTVNPIPTTDAITIAGDPRLQLGDTLTVKDPNGFGEEMGVQIYGINRTFSLDNGLTDVLTVEMIRPSLIGLWDSAQYGLWDSSFRWSA